MNDFGDAHLALSRGELLTPLELSILERLGVIANDFAIIMGDDGPRDHDMNEVIHHIHILQHAVMGQAAARAYPAQLRLLGKTRTR